jgi:polar amino acid transport system permease protein
MGAFVSQSAEFLPVLLRGVQMTVVVTAGALLLSTLLGLVWAFMRISGLRPLAAVGKTVIYVIRGIPALVQLFYIYFVAPDLGLSLTALQASIIGLGIAYSPYQAEAFRSGIEAVDRGQVEAAQSIGMGWWVMMWRVVLPQAVRIVLPTYGNSMVMVLKDSSLASTITVPELALQGKLLAASSFDNTTIFTLVALLYLCMSAPLTVLNNWLERRAARR